MLVIAQPMEIYRSDVALAASDLKLLLTSPYHFHNRHMIQKESDAMNFGTLVHMALLEPKEFAAQVLIEPKIDRRTKAYKDWKAAVPEDALLCSEEEQKIIHHIEARLEQVGLMPLLKRGISEAGVFCELDQDTDLKCRPDKFDEYNRIIVDLKTTRSLKYFIKDFFMYQYDFSVAHYKHVCAEHSNTKPETWSYIFVVVESEPPYDCAWFKLGQEKEEIAKSKWQQSLQLYNECKQSNNWPGFTQDEPIII